MFRRTNTIVNAYEHASQTASAKAKGERRDLSAGQRAMAMALLYPEPDKPGRGNKGKARESTGFSQDRLRQARQVLRYSRELAEQVRDDIRG